jgi:hypothetical protein
MGVKEYYFESVVQAGPEDRLLWAPAFFVEVEIFQKGLIRRPSYRFAQLWIDGLTGRELSCDQAPPSSEGPGEIPVVPPRVSERDVLLRASESRCGLSEGWRSWGSYLSVKVRPETLCLGWRLLILKEDRVVDGLTGEDHELGLLASFMGSARDLHR